MGVGCNGLRGWRPMLEMALVRIGRKSLNVVVARCLSSGFVVVDRTSMFIACIAALTWMIRYLSVCSRQWPSFKACFVFAGDLNVHHREWLGSSTTNSHGIAALDFSTVSGCDQLVVGPTHIRGGTLDLLLTDVPDLVQVSVVAPIGQSDHSSLSVVISTAQSVPNICISRCVFLKHKVNWDAVRTAVQRLPWHHICRSDEPVEQLNLHLSELVTRYVPTKVIRFRNSDEPWFNDDCRRAFDTKQQAYRRWTRDRSNSNWEHWENYRPISITPLLSKIFERLVAVRLGWFMEHNRVFPATQFAYRKGLGTCDALLCVTHKLQSALDKGMEARLVQIDFSAAFDRVNHLGIIHKLRSVSVGGSILSVLSQFLSSRSQYVMV